MGCLFWSKGTALSKGLVEIIEKRPTDPVEYLANYLRKFVENQKQREIVSPNQLVEV